MVNGRKIRELRENENLTTLEFAEKVHTSQAMISSVEIGLKKPGIELLKRIADYFGLAVDDLLESERAM